KSIQVQTARLGGGKILNAVRRENQIHVEWPVLDLHEILAARDGVFQLAVDFKTHAAQRGDNPRAVRRRFFGKHLHFLRTGRITQQDRRALADKTYSTPSSANARAISFACSG